MTTQSVYLSKSRNLLYSLGLDCAIFQCHEWSEECNLNGVLGALKEALHSLLSIFNVNAQKGKGMFYFDTQVEIFLSLCPSGFNEVSHLRAPLY